jgi:hypothetical protein
VAWTDYAEAALAPFVSAIQGVANTIFTVVFVGIDAIDALFGPSTTINELRARVEAERDSFSEEIAELTASSMKSVVVAMAEANGLTLDPDDPFSQESLTAAVNAKLGTQFDSLFEEEAVARELKRIAAEKVSEETGIQITDIENPEEWANFAAALIVDGANGNLPFIQREYVCPGLNAILGEFCKTPECHECMDDYIDCLERREKAQRNRDRYTKDCKRTPR